MEEVKTKRYEKVGILKCTFSNLIKEGIGRIGLREPKDITDVNDIENLDLMIVTDEETSLWKPVFLKCENLGIPVMFAFNFGIGSCVTVCQPKKISPFFILHKENESLKKQMMEYTRSFNSFWAITKHGWLDSVENWLKDDRVKNSIGVYAVSMAVIHTLTAMVCEEEVEIFPKFYLLSMVNNH